MVPRIMKPLAVTALVLLSTAGCGPPERARDGNVSGSRSVTTSNIWWPWSRNNADEAIVLYAGEQAATVLIRNSGAQAVAAQSFAKPNCLEPVSNPIALAKDASVLLSGHCIQVDKENGSLAIKGSAIMLPGHRSD